MAPAASTTDFCGSPSEPTLICIVAPLSPAMLVSSYVVLSALELLTVTVEEDIACAAAFGSGGVAHALLHRLADRVGAVGVELDPVLATGQGAGEALHVDGGPVDDALATFFAFDVREDAARRLEELSPGEATISEWPIERKDGSQFPAEITTKRLDDHRLQAFVRDVSERQTLEEQLRQSQKMEAVGILAGGVAHDFNNLLTAILGHTDFARANLPRDHKIRADIEEVSKAASRAAELTRQLLAFARKQIVEPRVIELGRLVDNLETMLKRVVGESIEVATTSDAEPWLVKVDPVQLEQVILNIAINARDAMPDGGRLALSCGHIHWRERDNRPELSMAAGPYATLTIQDTGSGMDAETLSHAFEPFYSTKDRTQGTGLGLAVSYGIIKQAGGYIWASSELDEGTSFRIFLPRARESDSGEMRVVAVHTADALAEGGETILLIEDEPLVRDLAVEVLNARHYNVLTARDGEEAIAIANAHPSEIHLTVTDVVLPAMSGKEVAQRCSRRGPASKYCSCPDTRRSKSCTAESSTRMFAFLAKPFTPAALSQKVRGVLDQ